MDIGYDQPLYVLPFDHRSSFEKTLFGWNGPLSQEQTDRIAASKRVIYDAFRLAVQQEGGDKRSRRNPNGARSDGWALRRRRTGRA
jgi:hypothetical protein